MNEKLAKASASLNKLKTYWSNPPKGRFLPFKEMGAYAAGGMGVAFVMNIIYLFINAELIPYIYKIDVLHGQNIVTVVAILTLFVQPIFGTLLDNSRSKMGKFKLFVAILTPVAALFSIAALWVPQNDSETFRTVYAYITCVPALMLGNMWNGVYNMVPAGMTPNSQERTDMLSPVGLITSFAPTILNVVVGPVRNYFISINKEYLAFRILALVCIILGACMTYMIVFFTKERIYVEAEQKEKIKFFVGLKMVLKNKPYITYCIANIFGTLKTVVAVYMTYIAMFKYSNEYGKGIAIMSGLSLITGFGATPGMIIAPFLSRKLSKRNILIFSQILSMVPCVIALIIGFDNMKTGAMSIIIFTVLQFFFNFNSGISIVISPAITAEQYDYQQYVSGKRLEGFMGTFSCWTTTIFVTALGYVPKLIQKSIGFQPGDKRFSTALVYQAENMAIADKWFTAAALISIIATVIWSCILLLYKLDDKEHKRIMGEIENRTSGKTFDEIN